MKLTTRNIAWNAVGLSVVVAAIVAIGVAAAIRHDWWGDGGSGLSQRFDYDVQRFQKTDPQLIGYNEAGRLPLEFDDPRGVAVGPDDKIYVVGDRGLVVLDAAGKTLRKTTLDGEPQAVALGEAAGGPTYVAFRDRVQPLDPQGAAKAAWESLGPKAVITSLAVGESDVFVADAGNRVVLRYDLSGKRLGTLGTRDEARNVPGLIVPSPHLDVALAPDGLLRVVNPGCHRIEAYTYDGALELAWGEATANIKGFCGCCNPAAMALLADGRIVTAEKGIPRVKVYAVDGKFECVVVGPESLLPTGTANTETRGEHQLKPLDVAVDRAQRVLVLDPATRSVRVYEKRG